MEKETKIAEFKLRQDNYRLSGCMHGKMFIWQRPDNGYSVALTGACDPYMFMQPGCDCRSYYAHELANKVKGGVDIHHGSRTCLYGFWHYFEEALKHFEDLEPKMMYEDRFNGLGTPRGIYWFVVNTNRDLDYIKSVLPKIFKCEIKFI